MLDRARAFARSHHAWLAALGLAGLALYHATRGEWGAAGSGLVTAGGLLGLHLCPRESLPAADAPPEGAPHEDLSRK